MKLKKRNIVAVLITLLVLVFTNSFWLIKKSAGLHFHFEFEVFTIILILSYLLSYKLVDYLADFKTLQNKSRIEIIFLTMFFVVLFIPMSHINQDEISQKENRTLAKCKSLITQDGKINYNFGKDFDSWFNDRFNFREKFILINPKLYSKKDHDRVLFGKDGWLFYKGAGSVTNYRNAKRFKEADLVKLANYLVSIDEYCKKNNKKFYFFIAPDKNKIYGEFYPKYIIKTKPDSKSRANQLVSYLENNTDVKVIYPYNELHKNKDKGLLYYKQDTHWNSFGAYIGYNLLLDEIEKDFKNIYRVKINDFSEENYTNGDLVNMILGKTVKDDTKYIKVEPNIKYKLVGNNAKREDLHSEVKLESPSVSIYRDSFSTALIPFISNTFNRVDYFWRENVKESEVLGSDIIVLEKVERNLPMLLKYEKIETLQGEK